ncbi:hypothetical protein [Catalinimonas niigatensis]|uniref:hypothetical protein n=1 Tax=Catalinimonas niigatensis TaxID=1397264 RepID=UPI0026658CF7|nr:hypothetical protein [Catalinimonas niigatensis]WPP51721.1 hypothetical protein PZB72_04875 [Catalinimonas niigatensis]
MKNNTNVLVSKLFAEAQRYIENASSHPEIQKKMSQNGFTPKRYLEGRAFLDAARAMQIEKHQKYGEKQDIASQIREDVRMARQQFMEHVAITKFAFRKMPSTLEKFNVRLTSRKIEAWLLQASEFYRTAALYSDKLSPHGLSAEEISQSAATIEALSASRNQRIMKKGDAEEATRLRDQSLKALRIWMQDFRGIAKVALRDTPQLLEVLGMVVKTQKV